MKFNTLISLILGFFLTAGVATAMENMDHSKMDHSKMDHSKMDHSAMDKGKMDHSDRFGTLFHESKVEGFTFAYYLMDMRKMKGHSMDNMADKPHHIMVYITDPAGVVVDKARVGFLIKDAAGMAQKNMAMYMSNGFGIMADMKAKGSYTITAKAVVGDKKLLDRFTFEVK